MLGLLLTQNSVLKKIFIGISPLLLILVIAFVFCLSQIVQTSNWSCAPERYYTDIKLIVDKYPALFNQAERNLLGNYTVTKLIANRASNLRMQDLWSQFLLTIYVTVAVIVAFSLPTIYYWCTKEKQSQKSSEGQSFIPQIHIDARLRFIETLMTVCGIVISFFGGSAFLKGTIDLIFFVGFVALIASLISGFLIFGYVRGGIGLNVQCGKIEFDTKTQQLLGNIAPWQFWLLAQGVSLLVFSIVV